MSVKWHEPGRREERVTTHERMKRMYEHREADRVPIVDIPWGSTIERWVKEGMPADADYVDYLGLDRVVHVGVDNSPRYPVKVLEETDTYRVATTNWGVTYRNWKHTGSVPQFLDFKIVDPESWREARGKMKPDRSRVNWDYLEANYDKWRERGDWVSAQFWFGFDITHSWAVGTERVLEAMATEPEWMADMFNYELDTSIALFEMAWDAGYRFDEIMWYDDMGYKGKQFFSLRMYRELLKPVHKRAADWAHDRGIKVYLHSCGDIHPMVPDLLEVGIDMLNPLEVKAGMNPVELKKQYGQRLAFHGGLNAVLYSRPAEMWEEMRRVIPAMKERGGYVIGSDHSVPETVSLDEFREFVGLAKELGSYK